MDVSSRRHLLVKRLVVCSLALSGIFGINSFFFFYGYSKLSRSIEVSETLDAIISSFQFDESTIIQEYKDHSKLCQSSFPGKCEPYLTSIIKLRNRFKDYQITLSDSLDISNENILYKMLSDLHNQTNIVAKQSFGISFEEAKKMNLSSANDYMQEISDKLLFQPIFVKANNELSESLEGNYLAMKQLIQGSLLESSLVDKTNMELNWIYYILILSEISLFLLVAFVDTVNNNTPRQGANDEAV